MNKINSNSYILANNYPAKKEKKNLKGLLEYNIILRSFSLKNTTKTTTRFVKGVNANNSGSKVVPKINTKLTNNPALASKSNLQQNRTLPSINNNTGDPKLVSGLSPEMKKLHTNTETLFGVIMSKIRSINGKYTFFKVVNKTTIDLSAASRNPVQPAAKILDETFDGQKFPQEISRRYRLDTTQRTDIKVLTADKINVAGTEKSTSATVCKDLEEAVKKVNDKAKNDPNVYSNIKDQFDDNGPGGVPPLL